MYFVTEKFPSALLGAKLSVFAKLSLDSTNKRLPQCMSKQVRYTKKNLPKDFFCH